MPVQSTPEDRVGRDSLITRAIDWIFGYDFFLSYSHSDGLNLPRHIKDRLTRAGFHVFLDQTEYAPGIDLRRETRRQVHKSRKVVVIARPAALKSPWVKREVDAALAAGLTPVIFNVNSAVETAPPEAALATMARENYWLRLNETLPNADGEPSDRAIADLVRGFDHTRQETKRQRVLTAAAAVLAIAAGVAVWQAVEATRARLVAEAQRDRAERVLDQVVATANRRVQSLSQRVLKKRAAVTAAAPPQVETAALEAPAGPPLEQAMAWLARGAEDLKAGEAGAARAAFQSAFDILPPDVPSGTDARDWQQTRARALDRVADAALIQRDTKAAVSALETGLALAEAQSAAVAGDPFWRQAQAYARQRLADVAQKSNDADGAARHLKAAIALWKELSATSTAKLLAQRQLAKVTLDLGQVESGRAGPKAALPLYYESLTLLKPLAGAGLEGVDSQRDLSAVYQSIADAHLKDAAPEKALGWVEADIKVATYVVSYRRGDPARQRDLASSYDRLARTWEALGRTDDAIKAYTTSSLNFEAAVARDSSDPSWLRDTASVLESRGKLLAKLGRADEAIAAFRHALTIREGLAASYEETSWQREVEASYRRASEVMLSLGRTNEAFETAEQYLLSASLMADTDGSRAERIGRALGTLSWSALNARAFQRAEWAAKGAVVLAPDLDWVRLNYAHALMLTGQREKAKALYAAGLTLPAERAKTWRELIAKDFDTFGRRKIHDPLMAEVLAEVGS
ncbi:MAG: toll/interleukin-1 receptor domain-containing protein [Hyphomicrobium sp.]|uniref:toll/interleukin-1 receptor domain-containing protein n=1 Tax=Hyphomicrobium sp. TaxID=82 RepID=UPI003D0F1211